MKHRHILAGASALALAVLVAAVPASAQSTGGATPQGSGAQTSPSTGALPDNSLAGQRQGTVGGGVTQGGGQSGTSGSTTPDSSPSGASGGSTSGTGALPDNSLAGQRQGTIGGGSVTQGGNSASEPPKQGTGQ
ncbi:hypothetical protein [Azospirillum brasilense]|uniref:Uncharacterized protein n=1 Tax=Azospirillum brasilense TaxID=192 RepID=A0A235H8L3_AZOBR|nr:hypothetical protein [Azospirillum brasilense]OYD82129.1 hypothetical protein CHT98_22400 [Azospirillum brasilense]